MRGGCFSFGLVRLGSSFTFMGWDSIAWVGVILSDFDWWRGIACFWYVVGWRAVYGVFPSLFGYWGLTVDGVPIMSIHFRSTAARL